MKREHKDIQDVLDEVLRAAIQGGERENAKLKEVFQEGLTHHLTTTGKITVPYLLESLASSQLSGSKQRLRKSGQIELVEGNVCKLVGDLSANDADFIDLRRKKHIKSEIETRVEFNRRYNRPKQCEEAERQLLLFSSEETLAPVSQ